MLLRARLVLGLLFAACQPGAPGAIHGGITVNGSALSNRSNIRAALIWFRDHTLIEVSSDVAVALDSGSYAMAAKRPTSAAKQHNGDTTYATGTVLFYNDGNANQQLDRVETSETSMPDRPIGIASTNIYYYYDDSDRHADELLQRQYSAETGDLTELSFDTPASVDLADRPDLSFWFCSDHPWEPQLGGTFAEALPDGVRRGYCSNDTATFTWGPTEPTACLPVQVRINGQIHIGDLHQPVTDWPCPGKQ